MRIIRITDAFPPPWTGLSPGPFYLSQAQVKQGHQIHLYTKDNKGCEVVDALANFQITRLRQKGIFFELFVMSRVLREIKENDADYIHIHGLSFSYGALLFKLFSRKKIIITFHIVRKRQFKLDTKIRIPWTTKLDLLIREWVGIRVANKLLSVSESIKQELLEEYPLSEEFIVPVYNGVSENFICDSNYPDKSSNKTRLLFVGVLNGRKDIENLLESVSRLNGESLETELSIVGDGEKRDEYIRHANNLGIGKKIRFIKYIANPELADMYKSHDIFVLPSTHEGLPKVLLEAMGSGLPVVVSEIQSLNELVTDANGLLFSNDDKESLYEKLKTLITDPAKQKAMSEANIKLIKEQYTWDSIAKNYDKAIGSIKT